MHELFIPEKFQDIVMFRSITDSQGRKIARGVYDPNTDTIGLDLELADIATFCEELYHRKQHAFLVAQGLYPVNLREHDIFYTEAEEIGIRPTIRDIAVRTHSEEKSGEITINYMRYFHHAANFTKLYLSIEPEIRDQFMALIRGNRLFDGVQAILEYMSEGYSPHKFSIMRWFSDAKREGEAWSKINDARTRW